MKFFTLATLVFTCALSASPFDSPYVRHGFLPSSNEILKRAFIGQQQMHPSLQLYVCIDQADTEGVRELLAEKAKPWIIYQKNNEKLVIINLLNFALYKGNPEIVRLLLQSGASIILKDSIGLAPLDIPIADPVIARMIALVALNIEQKNVTHTRESIIKEWAQAQPSYTKIKLAGDNRWISAGNLASKL